MALTERVRRRAPDDERVWGPAASMDLPGATLAGSLSLVALALVAFWPGYLSRTPAAVDRYTHFHAAIATLWLALLIAQPWLVLRQQYRWHRVAGGAAWLLAPLFVVSTVLLAHFRFSRMDDGTFAVEAYTLYLPLSAALLFAAAFALAMSYRRVVPLHARFMACTALLLVDPVMGRVLAFYVVELPRYWQYQLITFGVEGLVVLWLATTIPSHLRGRRVFALFAAFYLGLLVLWFVAAPTSQWRALADWFRRLPFT